MKRLTVLIFMMIFLPSPVVWAGADKQEYKKAVAAAKNRQIDFAYMHFRAISRLYAKSKYRDEALFAEGEYLILFNDLSAAAEKFRDYVEDYPEKEGKIFALAHQYEAAKSANDQALADQLRDEIVALHQVSLVFREFKEHSFKSPMFREYRVVFQIDTIEFYVNGELYSKIAY